MASNTQRSTLASKFAGEVDAQVRRRGVEYFRLGSVTQLKGDDVYAQARVIGSSTYTVELDYIQDEHLLLAYCDCPYLHEHLKPCKHIWATILAADHKQLLGPIQLQSKRIQLIPHAGEISLRPDPDPMQDASPEESPAGGPGNKKKRKSAKITWADQLDRLQSSHPPLSDRGETWPEDRQILYIIDATDSSSTGLVALQIGFRQPKRNGEWSKIKYKRFPRQVIEHLPDPIDRQIISLLMGANPNMPFYSGYQHDYRQSESAYILTPAQRIALIPMIARTGRCVFRDTPGGDLDADPIYLPMTWQEGPPWEFQIQITQQAPGMHYQLSGYFQRDDQRMIFQDVRLALAGGLLFTDAFIAPMNDHKAFEWITLLWESGPLSVPVKDADQLIQKMLNQPALPPVIWPAELAVEQIVGTPRPCLRVRKPGAKSFGDERLVAQWSFDYDGSLFPADHPQAGIYQAAQRRYLRRNFPAERQARQQLHNAGFRHSTSPYSNDGPQWRIPPRLLPRAVQLLAGSGWLVEAEGKVFRSGGSMNMQVVSGIDWFELQGDVAFDGHRAALPDLLAALKRGESTVLLDDGTYGVLPEQWLKQYAALARISQTEDDHLRFTRMQAPLLDALLADQPQITCDPAFAQARKELQTFQGVQPADPPAGFIGRLRPYQRDGLGWLEYLRRFNFGGCLADDMGLGKTVQVLAMLESRRMMRASASGKKIAPSLVVAPRSLIFNWIQEAGHFTPRMRVMNHTGILREKTTARFADHDLILTTYGTLRQDAMLLKDFRFDYVILDESQAVKNADTASAKAARLLQADHRLALSGTPIENHLGELWSLLEFLNPGITGGASLTRLAQEVDPSADSRQFMARAVRPFFLRRTKRQVATDLPEKTQQTLYCELEPDQRRLYDQLRAHYRASLLPGMSRSGIAKTSKIQILEALLRLRQAACHPGLLDAARIDDSSAKLDALIPQIAEVIEEGSKALVFSQFTSMLAIVKRKLEKELKDVKYEYLDGKTRDRAERVRRFQEDPECKLFLISLKAGGVGLNLTAAEYVFLLDPWWNPAVEAQAIDRAHRIGQTKPVFAYRLIARDTVEEKVLQLQESKRELADAVIAADEHLLKRLDRESLELLLS